MCTNGINTGQFDQMIEQIDAHVALEYRWTHKLAHQAEDGGFETCHNLMHEASEKLAEVRSLLEEARQALEDDAAHATAAGTEVHMV